MSVQQWKVEVAGGQNVLTYGSRSVAEEVAEALREVSNLPVRVYNGMTTHELESVRDHLSAARDLITENRDANFFTGSTLEELLDTAQVLITSRNEAEAEERERAEQAEQLCAS